MAQWHDVLTSPGGWTCSCSDSGPGGPDEADDHVVAAFEVDAALRGLAQASDEDERV